MFVPTLADVLHAITTLYEEEMRPFRRILRKRVGELAGGGDSQVPDVDARCLHDLCHASDLIYVELEEGGDWSALLPGVEATFVDVYSASDPYPEEFWSSVAAYFEGLPDDQISLPGARYSCALVLADRRLPFLVGHSLGQVCHIVQLAITQRKLLGYLNGALVPYHRSLSMLKERCAMWQQPCALAEIDAQAMPLASIEVARAGMRNIFEFLPGPKPASMPLSNVKRLFRSRLGIELSETALGFAKLCDMLQNECFSDICIIRLDWNGYVVVQKDMSSTGAAEALPLDDHPRVSFCPDADLEEDCPRRWLSC